MPSLHLDIPSIDWIERPPCSDGPGRGRARPAGDDRAPARKAELAKQASGREARETQPWPRGTAEALA